MLFFAAKERVLGCCNKYKISQELGLSVVLGSLACTKMADNLKTVEMNEMPANSRKRCNRNSKVTNSTACKETEKKSKYFSSYLKTKKQKLEALAMGKTSHEHTKAETSKPVYSSTNLVRLGREFYDKPTEELAKSLLGKVLYRVLENGEVLCGRIVETEAYLGEVDKACHSFGGRKTERTKPMFMAPGTAYVYVIYGMYHCFNISSGDRGACVLVRAMEPIKGLESMKTFRGARRRDDGVSLKENQISNGPSKLCQALCVEKANLNMEDMAESNRFWVQAEDFNKSSSFEIITTSRIGIDSYGKEWATKPLRFYILGNKSVSVRDKEIEAKKLAEND